MEMRIQKGLITIGIASLFLICFWNINVKADQLYLENFTGNDLNNWTYADPNSEANFDATDYGIWDIDDVKESFYTYGENSVAWIWGIGNGTILNQSRDTWLHFFFRVNNTHSNTRENLLALRNQGWSEGIGIYDENGTLKIEDAYNHVLLVSLNNTNKVENNTWYYLYMHFAPDVDDLGYNGYAIGNTIFEGYDDVTHNVLFNETLINETNVWINDTMNHYAIDRIMVGDWDNPTIGTSDDVEIWIDHIFVEENTTIGDLLEYYKQSQTPSQTQTTYDNVSTTIQLVEHEYKTEIATNIVFDRIGFAQPNIGLGIMSNDASEGIGYAFAVFRKDWLSGKTFDVQVDYNLENGNVTVGIYDGNYSRMSASDFPIQSPMKIKGNGKVKSIVTLEGLNQHDTFHISGTIGSLSNAVEDYVTFFIFMKDLSSSAENNISIRYWAIGDLDNNIYWKLYPDNTLYCYYPEGFREGNYENSYGKVYYYDNKGSFAIDPDLLPNTSSSSSDTSTELLENLMVILPLLLIVLVFSMLGEAFRTKKKNTNY